MTNETIPWNLYFDDASVSDNQGGARIVLKISPRNCELYHIELNLHLIFNEYIQICGLNFRF